jgi:trans-aconitate methyltransferase
MTSRALSFGEVAVRYERFRPGYPDELVDAVLDYAGRPVRQGLEIGAGTGKATRAFAARGVDVTATDPDGAMLGELRRHVPDGVVTMQASLEDLGPTGRFDLVFVAASLHWTEPSGRWPRIAARLRAGRGRRVVRQPGRAGRRDPAGRRAGRPRAFPWRRRCALTRRHST